jgi:hypothetical protein
VKSFWCRIVRRRDADGTEPIGKNPMIWLDSMDGVAYKATRCPRSNGFDCIQFQEEFLC